MSFTDMQKSFCCRGNTLREVCIINWGQTWGKVTEMFPSASFYLLLNRFVDRQHFPFYSAALRRNHWEEQRRL